MTPRTVVLTGGVGGAKLVLGLAKILLPENLTAIVNTADDFTHLGLAISPGPRAQNRLVAKIDRIITNGLPRQMVGNREQLQPVAIENVLAAGEIICILGRAPDIEMLARTGQFQPIIPPPRGKRRDLLKGQVHPLAREQGHGRRCQTHDLNLVYLFKKANSAFHIHPLPRARRLNDRLDNMS